MTKSQKEDIKLKDLVWFQAYEDSKPIQGRVKRIGTLEELNKHSFPNDTRIFYELETFHENERYNYVFTVTTKRWISKTPQEQKRQTFKFN